MFLGNDGIFWIILIWFMALVTLFFIDTDSKSDQGTHTSTINRKNIQALHNLCLRQEVDGYQ